jgi:hypothetical protein
MTTANTKSDWARGEQGIVRARYPSAFGPDQREPELALSACFSDGV